jgi:Trypsin
MRVAGPALAAALSAAPAAAVVGGAPDNGPLSRNSVMVLGSSGGVCSAVVVAPDAVLTAAHCVAGAAEHRVHWREASGEPALVPPAATAIHPGYDPKAIAARRRSIDLALLRLASPLPARFEPATLSAAARLKGESLTLGGYSGAREGQARSTGTFRTASLAVIEPFGASRILVWAQGAPGTGVCLGDSGGPIAGESGIFAVATWSRGAGGKACGTLSQGVLVGPQRDWIDRTLAAWGRSARWGPS